MGETKSQINTTMFEITIDGEVFYSTEFECLANFALAIAMMRFCGHEVIMSFDDIVCIL